ncbi:MAG: nicotinate phosphoribosyltransferase [Proteobacteria bacterium]|nr:nicotinate phosphoribosyltransferase [Pseudomonadota bacterium]
MMPFVTAFATDGYKTGHHQQYPKGTEIVYSNITPRSDKLADPEIKDGTVVAFGMQMAIKRLHNLFRDNFFGLDQDYAIAKIERELSMYLSTDYDAQHFRDLHELGYLPIEIRHVPEGTILPIRIPILTIHNTNEEFYWLPNFLETILSIYIWRPLTCATIAFAYKKILYKYNQFTDPESSAIWFQAHDFSMRGLSSLEDAGVTGVSHLTSFMGTDSLPAILAAREYYNVKENEAFAFSVPATEHSVMCANGTEGEFETFQRLITDIYPKGIVSIVSDTWDLWKVLIDYLPRLKDTILNREGKVVIRPDSGDPVDILCGSVQHFYDSLEKAKTELIDNLYDAQVHGEREFTISEKRVVKVGNKYYLLKSETEFNRYDKQYYFIEYIKVEETEIEPLPEHKGVIELLWEIFGGTESASGYKILNAHIGAIYGDSITPKICEEVCERLEAKGFASTNVVYGIGSFTYQFNTRDTYGIAMKATWAKVNGVGRPLQKDPVTDSGVKKSASGLLIVEERENRIFLLENQSEENVLNSEPSGLLERHYFQGIHIGKVSLSEIRQKLHNYL